MAIISHERFNNEDIYLDYDFEEVMFRYDHKTKNIYRKFYGEQEHPEAIHYSNRLYCDTRLFGDEITKEQYLEGREKGDRPFKPSR
ncbi:MAG: hypothetical protein H7336_06205 [Bacteriovorax sp.]|nr:hypothetical protein [Bacteriovorax sp.]